MYAPTLIRSPRAGYVHGTAITGTAAVYEVPASWRGARVIFQAMTDGVWIQFGTAVTIAADKTAVSSVASNVLTAAAGTSIFIPVNTAIEIQIGATDTHFSVQSDSSASAWRGWLSDAAKP